MPARAGKLNFAGCRCSGMNIAMVRSFPTLERGARFWLGFVPRLLAQRELKRIKRLPRYQAFQTRHLGPVLKGVDGPSCFYAFREIFDKRNYEFACPSAAPRIIDGGSNIGLSIIFFKRLFPAARVTGFEPDPAVFAALAENMRTFGLHDVELVNKALWVSDGRLEFFSEGADAGRVQVPHQRGARYEVDACRLSTYLSEPIDLLKLDIEGAEVDVLVDCADRLAQVRNLFVEYHSFTGQTQRIDELLHVLRQAGFRVQIHTQFESARPLVKRTTTMGMDFQADIAAYRE